MVLLKRLPLLVAPICLLCWLAGPGWTQEDSAGQNLPPDDASPLHWAVEQQDGALTAKLLGEGAEVNAKHDEETALHIAAYEGYTRIVKLLLQQKADVAAIDPSGQTPLFGAAWNGHTATAALLLASGASASAKDDSGYTPLHGTAWNGHADVAALLIQQGADLNAADSDGATPLHKAAWRGHAAVVLVLLTHKADVTKVDNEGTTPAQSAANAGHENVANLFTGNTIPEEE